AIAAGVVAVSNALLPSGYVIYGAVGAIPFIVIGTIAASRQWRKPSATRIAETVSQVRVMSWPEFAAAIEAGFRRDGYTVERLSDAAADFQINKGWRVALVSAKRWKVARTGVEPLRDLVDAKARREAHECIYVAVGEISENARRFAAERGIRLYQGPELAALLPALSLRRSGSLPASR
ncbi:MAG TPA: restriction endonuclease, partial [Burkholderiaceae bacterium]|nr:restriction endonuclease [Burkholderiaceae bacterium]